MLMDVSMRAWYPGVSTMETLSMKSVVTYDAVPCELRTEIYLNVVCEALNRYKIL